MSRVLLLVFLFANSVVLPLELLITRYNYPFFGNSFYNWVIMLALTLFAYLLSYFVSASRFFISLSNKHLKPLIFFSLLLVALYIVLVLYGYDYIYGYFNSINWSVLSKTTLFIALFILPLLFPLVIINPLLVANLSSMHGNENKYAGLVFGISTAIGIITAYLFILVLLPLLSLKLLIWAIALSALITALIVLLSTKLTIRYSGAVLLVVAMFSLISFGIFNSNHQSDNGYSLIEVNENAMGEIMVIEKNGRKEFFSNKILQTTINNADSLSTDYYVKDIEYLLRDAEPFSSTLILGTGGGGLINNLSQFEIYPDVVEIDERILANSDKYFGTNKRILNRYIDDARHYVKTTSKSYDIIIVDIFNGENAPTHILTVEGLTEISKILNENGVLIVYFPQEGYEYANIATNMLLNTFYQSGYFVFRPKNTVLKGKSPLLIAKKNYNNTIVKYHKLLTIDKSLISTKDYYTDNKPLIDKHLVYNETIYKSRNAVIKMLKK